MQTWVFKSHWSRYFWESYIKRKRINAWICFCKDQSCPGRTNKAIQNSVYSQPHKKKHTYSLSLSLHHTEKCTVSVIPKNGDGWKEKKSCGTTKKREQSKELGLGNPWFEVMFHVDDRTTWIVVRYCVCVCVLFSFFRWWIC